MVSMSVLTGVSAQRPVRCSPYNLPAYQRQHTRRPCLSQALQVVASRR